MCSRLKVVDKPLTRLGIPTMNHQIFGLKFAPRSPHWNKQLPIPVLRWTRTRWPRLGVTNFDRNPFGFGFETLRWYNIFLILFDFLHFDMSLLLATYLRCFSFFPSALGTSVPKFCVHRWQRLHQRALSHWDVDQGHQVRPNFGETNGGFYRSTSYRQNLGIDFFFWIPNWPKNIVLPDLTKKSTPTGQQTTEPTRLLEPLVVNKKWHMANCAPFF